MMGLVKANAYGHGIIEVSRSLASYGIDYLGVGFLEEGIHLRTEGITTPVLVLGGVLGNQISDFLAYDLDITVASREIADRVNEAGKQGGKKARVHLKIDTGMERIGVRSQHASAFIEYVCSLPRLEVVGLYSHFATSDERNKDFAILQLERFLTVLDDIRNRGISIPHVHIANSGAITDIPSSAFTMVRPGIMMYGIYPSLEVMRKLSLRPVLSLKSKVVYIKDVPRGTSVSYGRRYVTPAKTRIATIPIGYGDGFSRTLSNNASVLIAGKRFPCVGTICMDQLMVDIGNVEVVHVGDDVVLIGRDGSEEITAWDLAGAAGTIPYEILTGIATRVPRIMTNN
jgi:alanine racemase